MDGIIVQAAAGGVGLKAVEYAHWLLSSVVGTAGRPFKHYELRVAGVDALSSSRNSAAFAFGAMRLKCGERSHAVLNSLSLDFISVPLALLSEAGAFEEIGKRSIWASERHRSAFPATSYCAVALDTDMSCDPAWMHGVLELLSARADIHALQSLPLESFLLESQYELAFRALQSGLNLGKIVVRLAPRTTGVGCNHVVTGGTTGLGLLTGRWLAQRGAEHLVLASRSGSLAQDMAAEWEAVMASNTRTVFARCDTSEVQHVRRLIDLELMLELVLIRRFRRQFRLGFR